MAATSYAPNLTRTHWAGEAADRDIHLEAYDGMIEGSFRVESMFRSSGLTNYKPVSGTNTWRGDRVGGAKVRGRRSGEKLEESRIVNEKMLITVDTTSYIRTPMDYQDDWTAPDFQAEYSAEHGTAHAKSFDQAHVIQLIKAGTWKAPASLKASGAFSDGLNYTLKDYNAEKDPEAKADILVHNHKIAIAEFVNRDLGGSLSEFITLITPDDFNILLDHKKLMQTAFQGGEGDNNFAQRRIGWLNGLRVVETPRFPRGAISDHILGPDFNVSADEANTCMILFHPRKTLVTVEAQGMHTRVWDDTKEFANVLDSYCMYTVGVKRGDAVATFRKA